MVKKLVWTNCGEGRNKLWAKKFEEGFDKLLVINKGNEIGKTLVSGLVKVSSRWVGGLGLFAMSNGSLNSSVEVWGGFVNNSKEATMVRGGPHRSRAACKPHFLTHILHCRRR